MGERMANMLSFRLDAPQDLPGVVHRPTGIRHSVEVVADTLFEAATLGLTLLRKSEWGDAVAPGTKLEVQVREPATSHTVTLQQLQRWCDGAGSPREILKKRKVRELLGV